MWKSKMPQEPWEMGLFRNPGLRGAVGVKVGGHPWLTRSLPPVASLPPSVLKQQQLTGPLCSRSSVPQGKSSAVCARVSGCLGQSRTVKSSALEIGRKEDSLKEEVRRTPKTEAITPGEGDIPQQ